MHIHINENAYVYRIIKRCILTHAYTHTQLYTYAYLYTYMRTQVHI